MVVYCTFFMRPSMYHYHYIIWKYSFKKYIYLRFEVCYKAHWIILWYFEYTNTNDTDIINRMPNIYQNTPPPPQKKPLYY